MTTAAELDARTECRDLLIKLATERRKVADLEACKFRLNGRIVILERRIDELQAAVDAAQAGEIPY